MDYTKTLEMSREEWLATRQSTIGSSDVGAILGLSRYATPRQVFNVKKGLEQPFEGNDNTEWGTELEDFLTRMFIKKELGDRVEEYMQVRRDNKIRRHRDYAWATCNLDRLIVGDKEPVILELKTTTKWAMDSWDQAVPAAYYAQVQWQMFVTGYSKAIIWIGVLDTRTFARLDVDRNDAFIAQMFEIVKKFYDALTAGDPSSLPLELPDVEKMRPALGSQIAATTELSEALTALAVARTVKSAAEKEEKERSATVKLLIGDNEAVVDDKGAVLATYKTTHKDAYSVPAADYRVLSLKRVKGKTE